MTIQFNRDGGFSITYCSRGKPRIQWDHSDGPLLTCSDGTLHWLTWRDRISLFLRRTDLTQLDERYMWGPR